MKKRLFVSMACALLGCPKPPPVATADDATAPSAIASAEPSASASASASVAAPTPLAPDAPRADHETSVLALLRGTGASATEERATEPGKPFDAHLRDRVSPPREIYLRQISVVVEGKMDKEILERRLRSALDPYRTCYERALEKKADLEGVMTLRFEVAAGGAVKSVTDVGAKPSEDLVACAKTELAKLGIGNVDSPLKVTQTVRFSLKPISPN